MYKLFTAALFCLIYTTSHGQANLTAKVVDSETKEPVVNASISLNSRTNTITKTGRHGQFSISMQSISSNETLVISCIGYETLVVRPHEVATQPTIALHPKAENIKEVVVTVDRMAKEIVRTATKRFRKNCNKKYFAADIEICSYLFNDSTRALLGCRKVSGTLNSQGLGSRFEDDRIRIASAQISNVADSLCYTTLLIKSYYDYLRYDYIRASECPVDSAPLRVPYFGRDFFNNGHFRVEKDTLYNSKPAYVIKVQNVNGVNYDYLLPETELRKKHAKLLAENKERTGYTPSNKLFVCTESQYDSIFFSRLRKSFKNGNPTPIQATFIIDKGTNAILKMEHKQTLFPFSKSPSYENITIFYEEMDGKTYPTRMEIMTKSLKYVCYTYHTVSLSNFSFDKKETRIARKEAYTPQKAQSYIPTSLCNSEWENEKRGETLQHLHVER